MTANKHKHRTTFTPHCPKGLKGDLKRITALAAYISEVRMVGVAIESRVDSSISILGSIGLQSSKGFFSSLTLTHPTLKDFISKKDKLSKDPFVLDNGIRSFLSIPKSLSTYDYSSIILFAADDTPIFSSIEELEPLMVLAEQLQHNVNSYFLNSSDALLDIPAIYTNKIGHDLKNPLGNIELVTELMEMSGGFKDEKKGSIYLTLLKDANSVLKGRVDALSDLFKSATNHDIIKSVFQTTRLELDLKTKFSKHLSQLQFEFDDLTIKEDREALKMCISALIENSIEYADIDSSIKISLKQKGQQIRVTVFDQGPGIPRKYHKTILNPFETGDRPITRNSKSRGMGLSKVKMLCHKMNAVVMLDSAENESTTVTIDLNDAIT